MRIIRYQQSATQTEYCGLHQRAQASDGQERNAQLSGTCLQALQLNLQSIGKRISKGSIAHQFFSFWFIYNIPIPVKNMENSR